MKINHKKMMWLLAFASSLVLSACGGGGSTTITPAATYSISGTVTGATSVAVSLSGASTATATTDASGNYSFAGLANGSYTVTPAKAAFAFTPTSKVVSVSGANMTAINFVATAATTTYSISGTVSGAASSGVTIDLGAAGSVLTGAGGTYTIAGLVAGNYTVTPSLTGFTFSPASTPVTITNANITTGADFTATAIPVSHSISGNVSGATSSGVTITVTGAASPAPVTTDVSGNYTVSGLYDGSYTVTPSKTGFTFTPTSTAVPMSGADVTGKNFTAAVYTAPTYTLSGTVTGPYVEGVTISLTGGATTITNASGAYSFANLPAGTYTVTPSLAGYTYSPAAPVVPVSANTTQDFTASSAIASYSISGTVSYSGAKTGPVNLKVFNSNCVGCGVPVAGTNIALTGSAAPYTGTYTIRGLTPGSYVVQAGMDAVGTGHRNATNPSGNSATVTVAAANVTTGADVTLADPVLAAATPAGLSVSPSDGAAFIQWQILTNANGIEKVSGYKIYWGTDTAAASGIPVIVKAHEDGMYIQSGLANVATYYKISALVDGVESATSAVFGPVAIGATANVASTSYTVSGTVTFPGAATGPMFVGAYNTMNGAVYFTRIASPVSGGSYTVNGVPAGATYANFAVIDMNSNGVIDSGDVSNTNGNNTPMITVAGNTAGNITLTSAPATALANTQFYSSTGSSYSLELGVNNGNKRMKSVTLISGLNMPLPRDMGRDWNGFRMWQYTATTPAVGQSYVFRVTYTDNSFQDLTASVTAVLDASNLAQAPTVSFTAPGTSTVPRFSWSAPATAPTAAPYTYNVSVNGPGANWFSNQMPSTTTSVLYNADFQSSTPALTALTTYQWQVIVKDASGNGATLQAPAFTTP